MKQSEISLLTRERMAQALKKYMEKKPLEKITVREITEDCNLNRQTFYYHFQDIYDLTTWMFQNEAKKLLPTDNYCITWQDCIRQVLRYIQANVTLWHCALNSLGHLNLKEIFYPQAQHIMSTIIDELCEDVNVSDTYIQFLSDFYIESILIQIINWGTNPNPMDLELLIKYLEVTIYGNLELALKHAEEKHL